MKNKIKKLNLNLEEARKLFSEEALLSMASQSSIIGGRTDLVGTCSVTDSVCTCPTDTIVISKLDSVCVA